MLAGPAVAAPVVPTLTVNRTDFAAFGIGGLRGHGTGTLVVSGINGPVHRALLIWHGMSGSTTPLNPAASFAGAPIRGTPVGVTPDTTWGFATSQSFYADVSGLVSGNGNYVLTGLRDGQTFDPNGAALLVFYNDAIGTNDRDIAILLGNDANIANPADPVGWAFSLPGIQYAGGSAAMTLIVSDGQNFLETGSNTLTVNATTVTVPRFQGNTVPIAPGSSVDNGGLWDHVTVPVTANLVPGLNSLSVTGQPEVNLDAINLVGVLIDLPAGALPPPPREAPTLSTALLAALAGLLAVGGAARLRRRR